MSEDLGMWRGYMSEVVRGRIDPPLSKLFEMADYLEVDLADLVYDRKSKDFIVNGLMGLIQRVARYDATLALRFQSFADHSENLSERDIKAFIKGVEWALDKIEGKEGSETK